MALTTTAPTKRSPRARYISALLKEAKAGNPGARAEIALAGIRDVVAAGGGGGIALDWCHRAIADVRKLRRAAGAKGGA